MIVRHLCACMALLTTVACGSESNTGPSVPAEPTGALLVYDPTGTVHVVDVLTGGSREVSRFGEPFTWVAAAFGRTASIVVGGGSGVGLPDPGIRQLDLASGTITTLVEDVVVANTRVSPDGQSLIFAAAGWLVPRAVLATLELGGSAEPVVRWIAPDDHPEWGLTDLRWLPDQSGLIAQLYDIDVVQVVHFDLASGEITPLTEPTTTLEMTRTLDLSPDGRVIAYNTHTGELRFITRNGTPAAGYPTDLHGILPAISPDGTLLAWSRYEEDTYMIDGVWYYRFSDGAMWRALPETSQLTWVLDWG
jgi:hypothetical protein